jgi:hypothetical protein
MYPEGTCNFMPNSHYLLPPAYPRDSYTTLAWSFCWESPWVSKANGSVLNATSVAAYFEAMATPSRALYEAGLVGVGLDECNLGNAAVKGEREAAAVGFRNARKKNPEAFIAAWGAQAGDMIYASLMRDWTFSLAMVEGYSYCPRCGDWPASGHCCATTGVSAYYNRLDFARASGYLNRTVFCFGYMIGRSALNPRGWTHDSLEAEMVKLKHLYPELAGVLMYGGGAGGACCPAHPWPARTPRGVSCAISLREPPPPPAVTAPQRAVAHAKFPNVCACVRVCVCACACVLLLQRASRTRQTARRRRPTWPISK